MQNSEKTQHQILLIEDSEPDKVLTLALFEKHIPTAVMSEATSLQEAHQLLTKQAFDLIILDLNLPDGYGAANVKTLQTFSQETPIVALTAVQDKVTLDQCLKYGAVSVMPKAQMLNDDFSQIAKLLD